MPSVLGGLLCLGGAALALIGVFSGWVTLDPQGPGSSTVSAWALTSGDERLKTSTPYLVIVVALLAVAIGVVLLAGFARTLARVAAVLAGAAIAGITVLSWLEIASWVSDNEPDSFKATTSIGFYMAIAGGVLVALSALLPAKQKV